MKEVPKVVIYQPTKWSVEPDIPSKVLEVDEIPIDVETTATEFKKLLKDNKITYFAHCNRCGGDEIEIPLYPIGYVQGYTPRRIYVYFAHNKPDSKIYGIIGDTKPKSFWCDEVKTDQVLYRRRWFDFRI